jgi:NAD(P)-dependent dehydrogenase (short-subunit alcohol dehydrogenase family)
VTPAEQGKGRLAPQAMKQTTTTLRTPFGAHSTASEVAAGVDLSDKRAIVTGGSSGIGIETARALASAGATVTLAVRDPQAGERAAADIAATCNGEIRVARLDLADRASIGAFCIAWQGPLHILVNNAGIMALPTLERTTGGVELQFATNHLGHFALALGLHDALVAAGRARIVSVSSSAHLRSPVVFEDIQFAARPYEPLLAYGQSKTANVLFAVGATAHWAGEGISTNALMPGAIATNLQRHMDPGYLERARVQAGVTLELKSPQQGAATSVLLACSPLLEGVSGRYFEDCNEAAPAGPGGGGVRGVAAYAIDPENAQWLWEESLRLLTV